MKAAQPICIAFSNTDVSKSEVLISSNAIGVTGGNEGIITIPRFAGDWGVYRIVFFDKGLSVNAIVWFWVNSNPSVKPAKLINCGEIDLGANGCYFLNESFPEIRGSKHIEIAYWTSITPMSPLSVYAGADGRCYVFGSPNTKVRGLKIYYWK